MVVRSDGWVIDGTYLRKLGPLVLDAADTVVWLDLPMRVWMPRLLRRTVRRLELVPPDDRDDLEDEEWFETPEPFPRSRPRSVRHGAR